MSTVVLGGGLSGLSATYYFLRKLTHQPITLIEASNRLGGWIKTTLAKDDIIFEQGPRTIRPVGVKGANTLALIDELNLSDDLKIIKKSSPAARNRMIYANGKLESLPSSLLGLVRKQDPFSKPLYRFLLNDLNSQAVKSKDESIYSFAQRRFGTEVADYLISPLICGICAGDAQEVSVKFLMKNLFDYEQNYGSISKGLLRNLFKKNNTDIKNRLFEKSKRENWSVYSLFGGLETLTKRLNQFVTESGAEIKLRTKCERIDFVDNNIVVYNKDGSWIKTDNLISSLPAKNLAEIIEHNKNFGEIGRLLRNIKTVTVVVVNLHYKSNLIKKEGFGFLVPPKEKVPILGVIYDSCCFPKGDDTVLTVMLGGKWFNDYFGFKSSEADFLKVAKEELKKILGIEEEPFQYKVNVLKDCIPQYLVGHEENLMKIKGLIKLNGVRLRLCGASYEGVGVNDVIFSAREAVEELF